MGVLVLLAMFLLLLVFSAFVANFRRDIAMAVLPSQALEVPDIIIDGSGGSAAVIRLVCIQRQISAATYNKNRHNVANESRGFRIKSGNFCR